MHINRIRISHSIQRAIVHCVVASLASACMSSAWSFPPPREGDESAQNSDEDELHGEEERKDTPPPRRDHVERKHDRGPDGKADEGKRGGGPMPPRAPTPPGINAPGLGLSDRFTDRIAEQRWASDVAELDHCIPILPVTPTLPLHQARVPARVRQQAAACCRATRQAPLVLGGVLLLTASFVLLACAWSLDNRDLGTAALVCWVASTGCLIGAFQERAEDLERRQDRERRPR